MDDTIPLARYKKTKVPMANHIPPMISDGKTVRQVWNKGDGDGEPSEYLVLKGKNNASGHPTWKIFTGDVPENIIQGVDEPPHYVYLDDRAAFEIWASNKYSNKDLYTYWPFDFNHQGKIRQGRDNRGRPAFEDDSCTTIAKAPMRGNLPDYEFTGQPITGDYEPGRPWKPSAIESEIREKVAEAQAKGKDVDEVLTARKRYEAEGTGNLLAPNSHRRHAGRPLAEYLESDEVDLLVDEDYVPKGLPLPPLGFGGSSLLRGRTPSMPHPFSFNTDTGFPISTESGAPTTPGLSSSLKRARLVSYSSSPEPMTPTKRPREKLSIQPDTFMLEIPEGGGVAKGQSTSRLKSSSSAMKQKRADNFTPWPTNPFRRTMSAADEIRMLDNSLSSELPEHQVYRTPPSLKTTEASGVGGKKPHAANLFDTPPNSKVGRPMGLVARNFGAVEPFSSARKVGDARAKGDKAGDLPSSKKATKSGNVLPKTTETLEPVPATRTSEDIAAKAVKVTDTTPIEKVTEPEGAKVKKSKAATIPPPKKTKSTDVAPTKKPTESGAWGSKEVEAADPFAAATSEYFDNSGTNIGHAGMSSSADTTSASKPSSTVLRAKEDKSDPASNPTKGVKKAPKKALEKAPKKTAEKAPKKTAEDALKKATENALKKTAEKTPKNTPEKTPKKTPRKTISKSSSSVKPAEGKGSKSGAQSLAPEVATSSPSATKEDNSNPAPSLTRKSKKAPKKALPKSSSSAKKGDKPEAPSSDLKVATSSPSATKETQKAPSKTPKNDKATTSEAKDGESDLTSANANARPLGNFQLDGAAGDNLFVNETPTPPHRINHTAGSYPGDSLFVGQTPTPEPRSNRIADSNAGYSFFNPPNFSPSSELADPIDGDIIFNGPVLSPCPTPNKAQTRQRAKLLTEKAIKEKEVSKLKTSDGTAKDEEISQLEANVKALEDLMEQASVEIQGLEYTGNSLKITVENQEAILTTTKKDLKTFKDAAYILLSAVIRQSSSLAKQTKTLDTVNDFAGVVEVSTERMKGSATENIQSTKELAEQFKRLLEKLKVFMESNGLRECWEKMVAQAEEMSGDGGSIDGDLIRGGEEMGDGEGQRD